MHIRCSVTASDSRENGNVIPSIAVATANRQKQKQAEKMPLGEIARPGAVTLPTTAFRTLKLFTHHGPFTSKPRSKASQLYQSRLLITDPAVYTIPVCKTLKTRKRFGALVNRVAGVLTCAL
jgi:hypothetical protein